jgi:hypothetical protein
MARPVVNLTHKIVFAKLMPCPFATETRDRGQSTSEDSARGDLHAVAVLETLRRLSDFSGGREAPRVAADHRRKGRNF